MQGLQSYTVILEAGQTLFVPAGTPHVVENLSDTIGVSGNYVDCSNFEESIRALERCRYGDERSSQLLTALHRFDHRYRQELVDWMRQPTLDEQLDLIEQQF
jgi:hypothetical protein